MSGLGLAAEEVTGASEDDAPKAASQDEKPAASTAAKADQATGAEGAQGTAATADQATTVNEQPASSASLPVGQQALRRALDAVSELQGVLASAHRGDGPVHGHDQLILLRHALEDALVEVTRIEQQQTLVEWLEGEGLRAALAEVEEERVQAEAEAVLQATASAEAEAANTEPAAVDAARLTGIRRAIEDAPFKEGKMQVLTEQLRDAQVSSAQVAELIDLFAFSRDKVETLVFLYPRLVDPERFDELLATLKFASDRVAVRQRLGLSGS